MAEGRRRERHEIAGRAMAIQLVMRIRPEAQQPDARGEQGRCGPLQILLAVAECEHRCQLRLAHALEREAKHLGMVATDFDPGPAGVQPQMQCPCMDGDIMRHRLEVATAADEHRANIVRGGPPVGLRRIVEGDPVARDALVMQVGQHLAGDGDARPPQPSIQPELDIHAERAAGEAIVGEILERGAAMLHEEADEAVVAIFVAHPDQSGLHEEIAEMLPQCRARLFDVFRQSRLDEVELVGPVDQLDGTVDMGLDIMLDFDGDAAAAQEIVDAVAGGDLIPLTALHQLVMAEPAELGILPAREDRVLQHSFDDGLVGNLKAGHKVLRLLEVHRIVVDEQDRLRPQLHRLHQSLDPRSLGLPVHARKDEVVPELPFGQDPLDRLEIVFRADRADDAAPSQGDDCLGGFLVTLDAALGQGAFPEGLVEIPDHQPDALSCLRLRHCLASPGGPRFLVV